MIVSRMSKLTGIRHEREIDVTPQQLNDWRVGRGLIQDIMPNISADDREFIMTGTTPEEWAAAFPPEEDEE